MPNPIDAPKKKTSDATPDDTNDIVPSGGPAAAQAKNAAAIVAAAKAVANPPAVSVPTFGAGTTMNPNPVIPSGSALQGQSSLPIANTAPNGGEGSLIGASGEVPAVGSTMETTGHVVPGTTDIPSAGAPPNVAPVDMPIKSVPAVAKNGPDAKTILSKIISGAGTPTAVNDDGTAEGTAPTDWPSYLKSAVSNIGDFLQRWGLNEQGAPGVLTRRETLQAQQFELQKQQVQAQVTARQMALENQYTTQRMQLQNQMNIANLPIEKRADLQNQMALLDAQYQNEVRLLPLRVQQEIAQLRYGQQASGANDPSRQILDQGK